MTKPTLDKSQAQSLMREVLAEIVSIRNASEAYCAMINEEYEESNLYFLKTLLDMFGTDEKHKGIRSQAVNLTTLCNQVTHALEEYFKEATQKEAS